VAELVLDAALFFSSLTTYDPAKHRYMLRGMVGPDEFHTGYPGRPGPGIDDNAYTNLRSSGCSARPCASSTPSPPPRPRRWSAGSG
jgi:hypothetical protein